MNNATDRFMREYNRALAVQHVGVLNGIGTTISCAHAAWWEHSNNYCAQWLESNSEDPDAEMLRAIRACQARREK